MLVIRRIAGVLVLAAGLVPSPSPASDSGLVPDRFYGAAENGLTLRIEEAEDRGVYLQVNHVDARGRSRQLLRPHRLEPSAGDDRILEAAGPGRDGAAQTIRISFDRDKASLRWLQPEQLKFADGTPATVAGRHPLVSEAARRTAAERHFALADKELNETYRRLGKEMPAGNFSELQINQRQWLKFRDHFIADGDDREINGPGSIPFLKVRTARTLDRTEFLQTFANSASGAGSLGGRYSDGIDWVIRLDENPRIEGCLIFSLQYSLSIRRGSEWPLPVVVSGRGLRNGDGRSWNLIGKPVTENEAELENELILTPAADRRSLTVSGSKPAPFTVKLHRVAEPAPAESPMRVILLRLPAAIFDETTEGLSDEAKAGLAWTGTSGSFRLEEPAADFLRVLYPEGQVELRRFPRADGGAVIAVATANLRARSFVFWTISAAEEAPRPQPLEQALPPLQGSDFYRETKDAAVASRGLVEFRLFPNLAEIQAIWTRLHDGPEPDIEIALVWNGFGFEIERNPR